MEHMSIFIFLISFLSSIIGAISGIGGGVIIKPLLDSFGTLDISVISFLSGSTVLAMATITLIRARKSDVKLPRRIGTVLAFGGVIGGYGGKQIFDLILSNYNNGALVGFIQSILLLLMCIGVLTFTLNKDKIKPYNIKRNLFALITGIILGTAASFLGIGGGPINLAVLYFFFQMNSKTAALCSIYIIFFSQFTNLFFTIGTGNVPEMNYIHLVLMVTGGITGGYLGGLITKRITHKGVDHIFSGLLVVLIFICSRNIYLYGTQAF
jgi:uncharacterized membrane protein YfcA